MNNIFRTLQKFRSQKLKMFLLIIMYTVLFSIVLLLLIFSNSLKKQTQFIETYIENEVSIMPKANPLYQDVVQEINKAECINEYNVHCIDGVRLENAEPVILDTKLFDDFLKERERNAKEIWKTEFDRENISDVRIIETNNTKNSVFFLNKGFHIIEGRHINSEDKNKALISKEFSQKNNLHIGDVVKTLPCKNDYYYSNALKMDLEVVGIFNHSDNSFSGKPEQYSSNFIFTPVGPLSQTYITAYERMTVYLKPGTSIESLKKEISEKSLYVNVDEYAFMSSSEWASVISEPFQSMQSMSTSLLLLMLICIVIITVLIGAFYIRGNLRNIGILLSIGQSQRKVISQIVLEECVPLLLGALLALLIGMNCTGTIAHTMDGRYMSELEQIVEDKNEELSGSTPGMNDTLNELRTVGQVMRMETDFEVNYSVTWPVVGLFAVMIGIFLPLCFILQLWYKMKHFSVKQILLS